MLKEYHYIWIIIYHHYRTIVTSAFLYSRFIEAVSNSVDSLVGVIDILHAYLNLKVSCVKAVIKSS